MKYGSLEHKAECERRKTKNMAELISGQIYMIDTVKGDVVTGISDFKVFPSLEHVDWDVGHELCRPVYVQNCASIMFIESKYCFSFPLDAVALGQFGGEIHSHFLWGEKSFWIPASWEGKYIFFLEDAKWNELISSEEFTSTLKEQKLKHWETTITTRIKKYV